MAKALDRFAQNMGLKEDDTIRIHNNSNRTISLIAFSRDNGVDLHSEFNVLEDRAKNIRAGKVEEVKPRKYDLGKNDLQSQIHMLFRAEKFSKKVKPLEGEKIFLYTHLAKQTEWKLSLSLDEKKQVDGGPGCALGPTSSGANAAGPQTESQLRELKKEVEKLKKDLEALSGRITALEKALPNVPSSSK